jgi:werner syndrome ATP-dependent helicase
MDIISAVLQKHFGFSSLKAFQKEVLDAWFAHGDCVLLAATRFSIMLLFIFCNLLQLLM